MSVNVPIIRISQVTDTRWQELTDLPWYTEEEIIRNQITFEEVLANACISRTVQPGIPSQNPEFARNLQGNC